MRTQECNRLDVAREAVRPGILQHLEWLDAETKPLIKTINEHMDHPPDLKQKRY